jgi:DsbC/DsbD-like thiol-disulfide interchange protein
VGVPHPGTFIIDRGNRIVSRAFEQAYQERFTAASILAALQASGPAPAGARDVAGRYLAARVYATNAVAAPGQRFTLIVDVTPGPKMHVYAPGQQGYIPVAVTIAPSADFKLGPVTFPPPKSYFFAPLKETVSVFDRPFRIAQDITLALTPALRKRATARETLSISGTLDYQACDDAVCYRPDSVPLTWTITLTPIER